MSIINRLPTANESPDSTNGVPGDVAVSSPTNTGHASTLSSASGVGSSHQRSCRWHTFENLLVGTRLSTKLKLTHSSDGTLVGPSPSNTFQLSYTLNGGTNWTHVVDRSNFEDAEGPTNEEISLPTNQDLTQFQVRDIIEAFSLDAGDTAESAATVSNIKIEIEVATPSFLD